MKVLVATEKPFAANEMKAIKEEIEKAGQFLFPDRCGGAYPLWKVAQCDKSIYSYTHTDTRTHRVNTFVVAFHSNFCAGTRITGSASDFN